MRKKILLGALSLSLLGSAVPSYSAFAAEQPSNNALNSYKESSAPLSESLIRHVDQYVIVKDHKFVLKNKKELKRTLSVKDYETVENLVYEANSNLESLNNTNTAVVGNSVVVTPKYDTSSKNLSYAAIAIPEGKRAIKFHWWGFELWLTKTDVQAIIKGGVSGGATYLGAVIGGIGGAVAGAIASAIISEYVRAAPLYIKYTWGSKRAVILPQW